MSEVNRRTAMFSRPTAAHPDLAIDAATQARLVDLKIESVQPDPDNPRRQFDETAINALAETIKANGLIQPIVVRPGEGGAHIIIAGERRWRAARAAGFASIKAIIRPALQDAATLLFAQIAENESREPLSARDLVEAISRLTKLGVSQKDIAAKLGIDKSRVTRINALGDLPSALEHFLDTMAIDPLYELLQHHKRNDAAVQDLLSRDPNPTRSAIRSLGTSKGEGGNTPSVDSDGPAEKIAPAQLGGAHRSHARRVAVRVRHTEYGEGRVVQSPAVFGDRLPVLFDGHDELIQTALGELIILAVE